MPEIIFRADGNSRIGWGHVMRCLAIAEMVKGHFSICFAIKAPDENILNRLTAVGSIDILESESKEEFIRKLKCNEIVVLDGYEFDSEFQKNIKNTGCSLVCIDDLHNNYFYADLVINHAANVKQEFYLSEPYTKFLLGLQYAILRQEFLQAATKTVFKFNLSSLAICFGGSDTESLSLKFIEFAVRSERFREINVVAGANADKIRQFENTFGNNIVINVLTNLSASEMLDIFRSNDLVIASASTVSLEAVSVGIGIITGYYADNQRDLYGGLIENKLAWGLGNLRKCSAEMFYHCLTNISIDSVNEQIQIQRYHIDGLSGERITKELISLAVQA